jgi:ATP-dependent protease HslVU (ClpYQ) peptidase subunit
MDNSQSGLWHGTTILTVRKGGVVAVGGDGQVTIGQTIVKANAKKVRRLGKGEVRALIDGPLDAEAIVRKSLDIAAEICVYTNRNVTIETLKGA